MDRLPGWDAIMGLQFENLIFNNLTVLCPLIGLEGKLITSAAPYMRRKSVSRPGLQIDLLIQTRRSMMVVEIKRRREIGGDIVDEVAEKVKALRRMTDASIRTALVYDGHLAKTVPADGYFDFILPAAKLLGRD